MFDKNDFEVFNDDTLSGRLELIRKNLDPKFEILGQDLLQSLEDEYHQKFFLTIAKHQRRTKNPPPDTWLAINQDKKGYKKTPHLEFGLWPDRYFITFSLLADIRDRENYYSILEKYQNKIISEGWGVSNDHTSSVLKDATEFDNVIKHYQKVKSSDLVIGFELLKNDSIVSSSDYDQLLKDKFMKLSQYLVLFNKEAAK
ncbi:hypothetical protein CPEBRM1_ABPJDJAI_01648 [Companilactobacillus paralimentarius]|uniref:DUF1054 family protein n=1 Tax=Companilactobacillus paralimentarius TaxID=83526 RepID=UPI00384A7D70